VQHIHTTPCTATQQDKGSIAINNIELLNNKNTIKTFKITNLMYTEAEIRHIIERRATHELSYEAQHLHPQAKTYPQ
jgi:hypothetical protein